MAELGYSLSSEEHTPRDLVAQAVRAEEAGFSFSMISDHFHPWTDAQGQSAFVWSVIGSIAASTERLRLGTGVTCPTVRIHPAIIAQAAATSGCLMPGRFFLGLGSGEALNEHVTGQPWPSPEIRQDMLNEAVEVIRKLWTGGLVSHNGAHFTVTNARIYSLPDPLPPIYVAASGTNAAEIAGRVADGLIATGPDREIVETFARQGNKGPRIAQMTVCYAKTADEARETAFKSWPNAALKGSFKLELPLPKHFEEATETVSPDQVAEVIVCGPDSKSHLAQIEKYLNAGFDMIYVHQVGHDQDSFFKFYGEEILPAFRERFGGKVASAA